MSCCRETFTFNMVARAVTIDRSALQEGTSDGVRLNCGDFATRRKASTILPSALRRLAKAFIEPKKEPWCTAVFSVVLETTEGNSGRNIGGRAAPHTARFAFYKPDYRPAPRTL